MTNGGLANPMHDYVAAVPYSKLVDANARASSEVGEPEEHPGMDASARSLLATELLYLQKWRCDSGANHSSDPKKVKPTLAGLALSGGGIRSATFSLGVLQVLAAADKIRRFDYLSTR